jgi:hypothetical protein
MPTYELDVRFNYGPGDITIWFEDKAQARAYRDKTGSKCRLSKDNHKITLPHLSKFDYIRCSDHTRDLVFGFLDEEAAREWKEDLALVIRDGKEVRIKRIWGKGQLDKVLGVHRSRGSDGTSRERGKDTDDYKAKGSRLDRGDL